MQTVKDDLNKDNPKQILSSLEYDDAGNTLDIKSGFGYNREKLDETGNIYLRARYYNSRIGQFVQIDSYRGNQQKISSQQRYTYVINNQYKYVDRNGNWVLVDDMIIGIVVVAVAVIGYVSTPSGKDTLRRVAEGFGTLAGYVGEGIKEIVDTIPKSWDNSTPKQPESPTLEEPTPCLPWNPGRWNQLPSNVLSLIATYAFATWANYVFVHAKPTYNYKNKGPVRHIVPQKAREKTAAPKVNLHEARKMMDKNYPGEGVETRLNKIKLSAITHAPLHTDAYYESVQRDFTKDDEGKKHITDMKLRAYRIVLSGMDQILDPFGIGR